MTVALTYGTSYTTIGIDASQRAFHLPPVKNNSGTRATPGGGRERGPEALGQLNLDHLVKKVAGHVAGPGLREHGGAWKENCQVNIK